MYICSFSDGLAGILSLSKLKVRQVQNGFNVSRSLLVAKQVKEVALGEMWDDMAATSCQPTKLHIKRAALMIGSMDWLKQLVQADKGNVS